MSDKFYKYLTGFPKDHDTQYTLLNMTGNRKSNLSKRNKIEAVFMDLPKASDTLDQTYYS